jgi:hypothetical protein
MAAISDYLESQLLNFLFRSSNSFMGHTMAQNTDKDNVPYGKPLNLSIALTGRPPQDNDTGATIDEIPVNVDVGGVSRATNYKRYDLGSPSEIGDNNWLPVGSDGTNDSLAQAYSIHSANASKTFVPPGNSTPTTVLIGDGLRTKVGGSKRIRYPCSPIVIQQTMDSKLSFNPELAVIRV